MIYSTHKKRWHRIHRLSFWKIVSANEVLTKTLGRHLEKHSLTPQQRPRSLGLNKWQLSQICFLFKCTSYHDFIQGAGEVKGTSKATRATALGTPSASSEKSLSCRCFVPVIIISALGYFLHSVRAATSRTPKLKCMDHVF